MSDDAGWIYRVLRFITKDEVKTPLAFIFKILGWSVLALTVVIYAPVGDEVKVGIVKFVFICFLVLAAAVLLFAWWRPKNLVYGESGHRAEHKIEWGTEEAPRSRDEREVLPSISNPSLPRIENK
jgi:hypothetical protein